MANPDYMTTGLPYSHLVDSWQKPKPYREPLATDMDSGNIRLRRQPGDEIFQIQFDISFTNAQFATFETWVQTFKGVGRFSMKVYDGSSYAVRTVQFVQPYGTTDVPPNRKRVTFQLSVYPA